jgi:hypothetical protein
MTKLIELEADGTKILVEASDIRQEGLEKVGIVEEAEKRLEKILEVIRPFSRSLVMNITALGDDKPDSASAEFGLSFSVEGNAFFVKAAGEATLKVTLNWGKTS